jgi:predicted transcriptional regulator
LIDTDSVYTLSVFLMEVVMAKEAVFTMKLEPELRDAFMAAAAAADRPASQIVREMMRDYVRAGPGICRLAAEEGGQGAGRYCRGTCPYHEDVQARMERRIAELERKGREAAE